jgi:hypothetical protein
MATSDTLSDKAIRAALKRATSTGKAEKLSDGAGLHLEARPTGAGWWRLRYRFDGKEGMLSLGTYPDTTLAAARRKADDARRLLDAGTDPSDARKATKAEHQRQREEQAREDAGLPPPGSFEAVAREWLDAVHGHKVSSGHAERTRIRLEQTVFPWLGRLPLAQIGAPQVLDCLRRVEGRGTVETAHRVKQACGQVFRYGIATGRCERDPTADLATPCRRCNRAPPCRTDCSRSGWASCCGRWTATKGSRSPGPRCSWPRCSSSGRASSAGLSGQSSICPPQRGRSPRTA